MGSDSNRHPLGGRCIMDGCVEAHRQGRRIQSFLRQSLVEESQQWRAQG